MNEQDIILRCQQGDAQGLAELVLAHENSLFRFCFHLCGSADAAEELFQDTWLKALRNIGKYNSQGAFLGWLFTIAANLQRDKYRRNKRRRAFEQELQQFSSGAMEDRSRDSVQRILVHQAVDSLDTSLRILVTLYYFEDRSVDYLAQLLGLPQGTVKTRLHRARKHLKKKLEVLLNE